MNKIKNVKEFAHRITIMSLVPPQFNPPKRAATKKVIWESATKYSGHNLDTEIIIIK